MKPQECGESLFERLLQVLLPGGGYVAGLVETYFDESGSHDGSEVLCVAGYVFESASAVKLTAEWKSMLSEAGLPYFHMCECAPCGGIYAHLNMSQCDALARRAIGLIRQYMTLGYAITIETAHAALVPTGGVYKSPYTFACWQALLNVRDWANGINYQGDIAYFFEAGHDSQSETNGIFEQLFKHAYLKRAYRSASLSFAQKKDAVLLQCADLYAWHSFVNRKRLMKGQRPRKDYIALVEGSAHLVSHYGKEQIEDFAAQIRALDASPDLLPHDWALVMGSQPP